MKNDENNVVLKKSDNILKIIFSNIIAQLGLQGLQGFKWKEILSTYIKD